MPESVYIHIPFCKSKCRYCSFVSFNKPELINAYFYSLLKEISSFYGNEKIKTLYFGGGTPSLFPSNMVEKIISKFNLSDGCEITFEVNPDDTDEEYFKSLKKCGINRLSIGGQTFDDGILKILGRRHNSSDTLRAVKTAKTSGFENISIDLMYGLPTQTIDGLKQDIEKFLELDIKHISTYGLKIEEGTFFSQNPPADLPSDDIQADMYLYINERLEEAGFKRYEISNFAKKGYESKHNLTYWNNSEYYGFGTSAHGYTDGIRYVNIDTIEEYINSPDNHASGEYLNDTKKLEEEIFLGFRKSEGINAKNINSKFSIDFDEKYKNIISKYSEYIEKTPEGYRLNIKGVLISNYILADFLE